MIHKINEKYLTIILLFRFLFGGYIGGMDQYLFNDIDSASTVILIYALTGVLFSLYLFGKKIALKLLISLETTYLFLNILYSALSIGQIIDPGVHDPLTNIGLTFIQIIFSLLTLAYLIKTNRANNTIES